MQTAAPQQSGGMMGGLGSMVAQGFAWGVGTSVARTGRIYALITFIVVFHLAHDINIYSCRFRYGRWQ